MMRGHVKQRKNINANTNVVDVDAEWLAVSALWSAELLEGALV